MHALLDLDIIFWVLIILSVATLSVLLLKTWQWFSVRNIFSDKATGAFESHTALDAPGDKKNLRLMLLEQYTFVANKMELVGSALETEVWRIARL